MEKMPTKEYKDKIEKDYGLKVSVRVFTRGSMKGYLRFAPKKQNGVYPEFDFEKLPPNAMTPNFYSPSGIYILQY